MLVPKGLIDIVKRYSGDNKLLERRHSCLVVNIIVSLALCYSYVIHCIFALYMF